MKAEINSRVELVQILLYLADEQEKTIQYLENRIYLRSISDWFKPYKDHMAVKITKKLVRENNFFHIRPLRAILDLENILSDDSHKLNLWAREVEQFARESSFDDFFRTQSEHYAEILKYVSSCDFDTWVSYIENYFKNKPEEFHLIICPIAGNYGFNISHGEKEIAYTVRFEPKYDEDGKPDGKFDYFAMGIAHEYAHCYVNPVVEGNKELLNNHALFFELHNNMPQSYNVDYAVINEYFVRVFQLRFMEENHILFPEFNLSAEYERQRKMFIFIDDFVHLLKEYESCSMTFREFYTNNTEKILSEKERMKAIILDMYGVIVKQTGDDFVPYVQQTFPNLNPEEICKPWNKANMGELTPLEIWAEIGFRGDLEKIEKDYLDTIELNDGFLDFIKAVRKKYKLAILSNDSSRWSKYLREKFNIDQYFDVISISGDLKIRKPDERIFRLTMEKLAVKAAECLYIDDRRGYLGGARKVGMNTILFYSRNVPYEGDVVNNFEELMNRVL